MSRVTYTLRTLCDGCYDRSLALNNNQLDGTIPSTIGNLTALT